MNSYEYDEEWIGECKNCGTEFEWEKGELKNTTEEEEIFNKDYCKKFYCNGCDEEVMPPLKLVDAKWSVSTDAMDSLILSSSSSTILYNMANHTWTTTT